MSKKIIHLSDLHIGAHGIELEERFQHIINDIINRISPAKDYIIVITGDIVDNGERRNYLFKAKKLLNQLTNAGFKVLFVPGNHDCGLLGVLAFERTLKRFCNIMYGAENIEWPKIDIIDNIAFIGLNSMLGEIIDDDEWFDQFWANGEIGKIQLEKLKSILEDSNIKECSKKVVYLHHHPFENDEKHSSKHHLKDSEALMKILENKVDVLLFGHKHKYKVNQGCYNGVHGIERCYNAATSTGKHTSNSSVKPSIHRVIDLDYIPDADYDAKFNYGQDNNQQYIVYHNINEDIYNGHIIVEENSVVSEIYREVYGPDTYENCINWINNRIPAQTL